MLTPFFYVFIGKNALGREHGARYLGVYLDPHFKFGPHFQRVINLFQNFIGYEKFSMLIYNILQCIQVSFTVAAYVRERLNL